MDPCDGGSLNYAGVLYTARQAYIVLDHPFDPHFPGEAAGFVSSGIVWAV